jgi:hypothetical protein
MDSAARQEFRFRRVYPAIGLAASLWLLAIGLRLLLAPWFAIDQPVARVVFAAICLLVSAVAAAVLLRRLFDRRSVVVLSADGLYFNTRACPETFVPWIDIAAVHLSRLLPPAVFIAVDLQNPEAFRGRQTALGRRTGNRANEYLVGSPVFVRGDFLDARPSEIVAACQEYLRRYGKDAKEVSDNGNSSLGARSSRLNSEEAAGAPRS